MSLFQEMLGTYAVLPPNKEMISAGLSISIKKINDHALLDRFRHS
jgi:hypothetical protein